MNDTPGWASPGRSAPSDGDGQGVPRPAEPADGPTDAPGPTSKWSKEQPPADDWSAPAGPPPARTPQTPPPGWGGQAPGPGWGQAPGGPGWGPQGPGGPGWGAWQGRPQAAKPGVIPLRPLGVGEILDGAVSTMRAHWRTVLGISLAVAVVTQIMTVLLQGLVLTDIDTTALNDPGASLDELGDALGNSLLVTGVILAITLLGTIVATALLTTVTSRAVLGKPVSTAQAWADARAQLPKLFGLTALIALISGGIVGISLVPGLLAGDSDGAPGLLAIGAIAGLCVAVWLVVRLSLASPALMLEKQGIGKAMSRSLKLVRGAWWRIFGIGLLAAVIANILASIIVIPFSMIASVAAGDGPSGFLTGTSGVGWTFLVISGVGSVIASMLTLPVTAGVTVLLYIDQRIRREALDLDLARAAGVPGQGTGTPGPVPGS
ncbi:glycerophosphoryl diester phosphodiesterase membrane domain-containing protein [Streptomyces uncialis]|uniref:glycerophosphoryl diester phosphodiesterase membrane domain-containing protein n=1 Tax=Streptomyces uncialis TaxID=1048205 RepID=UPI00224F63DD|nr:glycerophosphoryl diester phosphodiesterase membrane domain-containing protein [Streptomyces uncialis]MCX4664201.1 glycerophosphoryl diester phosphodiesterase membrane domain-containing protein [Streptomyces uncialis]WST70145.1 glycerophosphoryl diester phosphodiesterase membrane domain-containing protein [Streptomyces uncialis]